MAKRASLYRRLLVGAAIFIVVALIYTGFVLNFVLFRFVQGQVDGRLDTQIVFLASMLKADGDKIALAGEADGPPFDRPARGWYWQVIGPANTLRSHALLDQTLGIPEFHRPPREFHPVPGDAPGPYGQTLHFRIQNLQVGEMPITIIATAPRAAIVDPLRDAMRTLVLSLVVLGIALIVAILLQVRLGLRPLERLRQAIVEVRAGKRERVPPEQPREIQPLTTELNALLDQNAENLERARRHVANLAHGLKTPLATLAIASSRTDPSGQLQALVALMERRIRHHLGRARAAALSGPVRTRTPVGSRLVDIADALTKIYAERNITVTQTVVSDLDAACEQQDFDEMAGNILDNAFKFARSRVDVTARLEDGRWIGIAIEDDGPGLRADQRDQVLRPGERLDEATPGFGFGLPIARELAELYGGSIELSAADKGGLRVTLKLPRAG